MPQYVHTTDGDFFGHGYQLGWFHS